MVNISTRSSGVASFKVMDVLERANQLQSEGANVLHLEVGQPATPAPTAVAKAAVSALSSVPRKVMGYTDAFGLLQLRQRIASHYAGYYDDLTKEKHIPTSRIVVTTGSSGAFLLAFTACFDAGDVVAVASSGYPCYRNILSAVGCEVATIAINSEFKLTAKELAVEIERRETNNLPALKGLILSSPSNPCGSMLSPEELKLLCEVTDKHNIQFLSDEIYHGISYGTKEATAIQYSSNAIIINSFSKYYSMSGWRLGWMIIPEALVEPINSLQQNMFINAPTISQTAALECWNEDCLKELDSHVEKYRINRAYILEELARIDALDQKNIAPADGGFYVYVDLGEENMTDTFGSVKMCEDFLEDHHVAFTPGVDFEDPATDLGNRRFRISYSQGYSTIKEAMDRFKVFWPTWMEKVAASRRAPTGQPE